MKKIFSGEAMTAMLLLMRGRYGDRFLPHGTPHELMERYGLSFGAILRTVEECFARG